MKSSMDFSRGGGVIYTDIMELNINQDLASVYQYPLLLVFLDLRKAYEYLYRVRLLKTLEGYGVGPKMWVVLAEFLARQEVVTQQNG